MTEDNLNISSGSIEQYQVQMLFDCGAITHVTICSGELQQSDRWQIIFTLKGRTVKCLLKSQRNETRFFKTLDAAKNFLNGIGFRSFTVNLTHY